jgi:choline dehydrogenase-like flavoprotein
MAREKAERVLIIGAGAAGLMAARELARAGRKVAILEARNRCGGRIHPLPTAEFGYPAEGGAEFVHGEDPSRAACCARPDFQCCHSKARRGGRITGNSQFEPRIPMSRCFMKRCESLSMTCPLPNS